MRVLLRRSPFVVASALAFVGLVALVACGGDDDAPSNPADGGSGADSASGTDAGTKNDAGGGGTDAGKDAADGGGGGPSDPNAPQTVTAGPSFSGSVPAGDDTAHYFKYVPGQAFASVKINVATLGPTGTGSVRWQDTTMVGLCDTTGGLKCCTATGGVASCKLSISPVVSGKTYYVIVAGDPTSKTDYAFSLVETP